MVIEARREEAEAAAALAAPVMDDIIGGDEFDTLVETPESAEEAAPKPRARRARKPKVAKAPKADADDAAPVAEDSAAPEAGSDPKQAAE